MGYLVTLHLINVKIKTKSLPVVTRALKARKGRGLAKLELFLETAVIDIDGMLAFKAGDEGSDPYEPYDDGTVPAVYGKWYEAEKIANWLKKHSEKGGRLILHSLEADGEAWGWEFDGRGRMRELALAAVGKWE